MDKWMFEAKRLKYESQDQHENIDNLLELKPQKRILHNSHCPSENIICGTPKPLP